MVCPFYYIAETEMEMEEWQSERKHEAEKEPGAAGMDSGMKVENRSLRIRVPAELDHHSAAQICAQADELVRTQDIREIVFDFSRTVFCDSSGVGMLMGRYKMMQALGGTVKAVRVQGRVERILMLSGVMKVIPVEREQGGNDDEK